MIENKKVKILIKNKSIKSSLNIKFDGFNQLDLWYLEEALDNFIKSQMDRVKDLSEQEKNQWGIYKIKNISELHLLLRQEIKKTWGAPLINGIPKY